MVMRARPNVTPTLLRLDNEARAMLDEYHAAMGGTLGAAGGEMIAMAYRVWQAGREAIASFDDEPTEAQARRSMPNAGRFQVAGSLSGKGYGPFGGVA